MRPLVAATVLLALGCATGLRWPATGTIALGTVILTAIAAYITMRTRARHTSIRPMIILFCAVGWGSGAAESHAIRHDCRSAVRDGARIEAIGSLEGVATPGGSTLLDARWLRIDDAAEACAGTLRVRLPPRADPPPIGATLHLTGRWWTTPRPDTRWPAPPERGGTFTVSRFTRIHGDRPPALTRLRTHAQARIRARFDDVAGMVEATLLARREALDPHVRDDFAASGLSHLLAISGTHVGMIAAAVLVLGRMAQMPVRSAAALSGALTTLYVVMLGAPHAAARAALQILLLVGARVAQRPADPFALMGAAAMLLIATRPLAVLDPGFQLSFAGVFGLIAFQAPMRAHVPRLLPAPLRETTAATMAATVTTLPIAALHFGLVSFIGIAANLAAVPLLALAVPAAALALAADLAHPAAGEFLAGGAAVPFRLLETTARIAADVPGGHAYWGPATVTAALLAGGTFVLVLRAARGRGTKRVGLRILAPAAAGALAIALLPMPAMHRGGALEIHAIDVGQGDAIAIRTPGGRWILVDTGPRSDRWDAGLARVAPWLRDHGARRIDLMILTHPDLDHIGGAPALIRALPTGALIDPAVPAAKAGFYETLDAARHAGVRWYAGRAGREITIDGVTLTLLAPEEPALDAPIEANDHSVVFRLAWGPFAALFTGDAPRSVENALVALHDTALAADLLKVGHHGSRTSTGDSLLAAARPRLALVSVGARNRYGHPDPGVVRRLERYGVRILRTDINGTIIVRVDPAGEITYTSER